MQPHDHNPAVPHWLRPEGQPIWLRALVVAAFVLVAALSVWRVVKTLHDPAVNDENHGLIDFHNVAYFSAVAYREGVNPYSAQYAAEYPVNRQYPLYSPAVFWLHYPFSFLPLDVANVVYYAVSFALVLALAVSVWAVCRVPCTLTNVLGLATLILVSRPGHINLLLGQVTLPMVLGALWALQLADRRPIPAGLALALTTIKPTFGVSLVWLMFCRRDFRAVVAGVAIAGAAAVAGLVPLIANDGWRAVLESLQQSQSLHESDPIVAPVTSWTRLDALVLVGKVMGGEPPGAVALAVTAGCLLAAGWAVWRISRTPLADGADSLSALIIATATLACIYHSTYDALLLVAPWVGAAVGRLRQQLPDKLRVLIWLLLTIPGANYLSAREVTRLLSVDGTMWTAFTMLNSICVVITLLLSIAAVFARTDQASRNSLLPVPKGATGSASASSTTSRTLAEPVAHKLDKTSERAT